jgi:hypothetical protein
VESPAVNLRSVGASYLWRRALALTVAVVVGMAYGCGPSNTPPPDSGGARAKLLKEEDLYKYVGEGKAKRKEAISLREKAKLLREAEKKAN